MMLVITGSSGSGKSTVRKILTERYGVPRLMNVTTRDKRPGETDGVDYLFTTVDGFEQMKSQGKLIEWVEYLGNLYGLAKNESMDGVTVLETEGALRLKKMFPDEVKIIYLEVPEETRKDRMLGRGDIPGEVASRLKTDREKFENSGIKQRSDLIIHNVDIARVIEEILRILKE